MTFATRATTHDLMDMVAELLAAHGCAGSASDVLAAKRFIPDVPVTPTGGIEWREYRHGKQMEGR